MGGALLWALFAAVLPGPGRAEPIPDALHALLRSLVERTGETAVLAATSGTHAVFVDTVESPHAIRYIASPGKLVPLLVLLALVLLALWRFTIDQPDGNIDDAFILRLGAKHAVGALGDAAAPDALAKLAADDALIAELPDGDAERAALVARFDHSQTIYQRDPWAARTEGAGTAEFIPLADLSIRAAG